MKCWFMSFRSVGGLIPLPNVVLCRAKFQILLTQRQCVRVRSLCEKRGRPQWTRLCARKVSNFTSQFNRLEETGRALLSDCALAGFYRAQSHSDGHGSLRRCYCLSHITNSKRRWKANCSASHTAVMSVKSHLVDPGWLFRARGSFFSPRF